MQNTKQQDTEIDLNITPLAGQRNVKYPSMENIVLDEIQLSANTTDAKELDEGLAKLVVAFTRAVEKGELSPTSQNPNFTTLIGNPHSNRLSTLLESIKNLNELSQQCKIAVDKFKSAIYTKQLLIEIIYDANISSDKKFEKYSQRINDLEQNAYDRMKEFSTQADIVHTHIANALDEVKLAENFRQQNVDLLQKNSAWATQYMSLMGSSALPSLKECMENARLQLTHESFYRRKLEKIQKDIPNLTELKQTLREVSTLKERSIAVYKENPERFL